MATTTNRAQSFVNTSKTGVRSATSGNKNAPAPAKPKGDQLASVRGVMDANIKGPGV